NVGQRADHGAENGVKEGLQAGKICEEDLVGFKINHIREQAGNMVTEGVDIGEGHDQNVVKRIDGDQAHQAEDDNQNDVEHGDAAFFADRFGCFHAELPFL